MGPRPDDNEGESSPDELLSAMDPLEPYTTRELAQALGRPIRRIRSLLDQLSADEAVRKAEPGRDNAIWIREAPVAQCPACGREFEVKYLHAVLTSVKYCPHCGVRLE
jgi:hypothetical protein